MYLESVLSGSLGPDYISQAGGASLDCNNGEKLYQKSCQDFQGCPGVDTAWMEQCTAPSSGHKLESATVTIMVAALVMLWKNV